METYSRKSHCALMLVGTLFAASASSVFATEFSPEQKLESLLYTVTRTCRWNVIRHVNPATP
jgi:hypothetical protein